MNSDEKPKTVHDIKNALSVILMRAELLLAQGEGSRKERGAVKSSAKAIIDQAKAIQILLDRLR